MRVAAVLASAQSLLGCAPTRDGFSDADATGLVDVDVRRQIVEIAPFAASGRLSGAQTVQFRATSSGDRLRFSGGPLRILALEVDGRPSPGWTMTDGVVSIPLDQSMRANTRHSLSVTYEAETGRGVRRSDDLAYSTYFACDWMLCDQADFDDRFTIDLTIRAPAGMVSVGPGEAVDIVATGAEERHRWRTHDGFPAYVHGFVVGRLERTDVTGDCAARLEVVSAAPRATVEAIFQPTCAMLRYFEGRAGVALPAAHYSQLYDPDRWEAQEAISHSVLGGGAVEAAITDPTEDWAVAHELAHQWWGNRVTARDLSQFWLNEGLVTFMVATWKEQRWGADAYAREIGSARDRWRRCREEWRDVPVAWAGDYPSLSTRRCFQYSKAAVFLDTLRTAMGEDAFWAGVRRYTAANLGRSVTSRDFEAAMQAEANRPLRPLFAEWVYPEAEP